MGRGGRLVIAGVAAAAVLAGCLLVLSTRDRPPSGGAGPTAGAGSAVPAGPGSGKACAPTRGERSQGTGGVAATAPSRARLGPGGEVERTPATVAAGRVGQRLVVSGTVYASDCTTPLAGASLEIWQTTAAGEYGPGHGTTDDRCCYLAAALRTDARGRYRFETVKPGHYKGEARPPPAHIHLEIRHPEAAGVLTELLFAGDRWLGTDPPGEVVRPTPVAGSDPPALRARFDVVLAPR